MVHDDAQTENICAMVVCLLLDDLRTEVEWSANLLTPEVCFFVDERRLRQVPKLEHTLLRNQHVHRLNVSVDNVMRMAVKQRKSELPRHLPDFFLREILALRLLAVNQLLHVAHLCKLHRNVQTQSLLAVSSCIYRHCALSAILRRFVQKLLERGSVILFVQE